MFSVHSLRDRWNVELQYWRLRWWQLGLLVAWSIWPWLCFWWFPAHEELWLVPMIPFLPLGYIVGGIFMGLLPGIPWAHSLGMSVTIFSLSYLIVVSWRWHRAGKQS